VNPDPGFEQHVPVPRAAAMHATVEDEDEDAASLHLHDHVPHSRTYAFENIAFDMNRTPSRPTRYERAIKDYRAAVAAQVQPEIKHIIKLDPPKRGSIVELKDEMKKTWKEVLKYLKGPDV
jgi:hypothetical protein